MEGQRLDSHSPILHCDFKAKDDSAVVLIAIIFLRWAVVYITGVMLELAAILGIMFWL